MRGTGDHKRQPECNATIPPVITWCGLPLVPCDKLHVSGKKTDILLMRTGEKRPDMLVTEDLEEALARIDKIVKAR